MEYISIKAELRGAFLCKKAKEAVLFKKNLNKINVKKIRRLEEPHPGPLGREILCSPKLHTSPVYYIYIGLLTRICGRKVATLKCRVLDILLLLLSGNHNLKIEKTGDCWQVISCQRWLEIDSKWLFCGSPDIIWLIFCHWLLRGIINEADNKTTTTENQSNKMLQKQWPISLKKCKFLVRIRYKVYNRLILLFP